MPNSCRNSEKCCYDYHNIDEKYDSGYMHLSSCALNKLSCKRDFTYIQAKNKKCGGKYSIFGWFVVVEICSFLYFCDNNKWLKRTRYVPVFLTPFAVIYAADSWMVHKNSWTNIAHSRPTKIRVLWLWLQNIFVKNGTHFVCRFGRTPE